MSRETPCGARGAMARASLLALPAELLTLVLARVDATTDHLACALACAPMRDAAAAARDGAPLRTEWRTLWGSVARARWALGELEHSYDVDDAAACAAAAKAGALDALQWLRARTPPCPWDASACSHAAGGGHLKMLKWMRAQTPPCPWNARFCAMSAHRNGHTKTLQWIVTQEYSTLVRRPAGAKDIAGS
jgi:hypothetical protein